MISYNEIQGYIKHYEPLKRGQTVHILCYSICRETEYPFIQYMLEQCPYIFSGPLLTLPKIIINTDNPISEICERIKYNLTQINCDGNLVDDTMIKGVMTKGCSIYTFVDITGIDINSLQLSLLSSTWFVLPSEIISVGTVCNIPIDNNVTELFQKNLELSVLRSDDGNLYTIPDAFYTGDTMKKVEFKSIFGQVEETRNTNRTYYFFDTFNGAVKEGGWIKEGGNRKLETSILDEMVKNGLIEETNSYGKYLYGGINRYAVFCDIDIDEEEIIGEPNVKVDSYDKIMPLSYHYLSSRALGEKFDYEKDYIII